MPLFRFALLFCLAFAAASLPAAADAPLTGRPDLTNPAYTLCQKDDECLAVSPACAAPVAVNTRYYGQVYLWYKRLSERMTCDTSLTLPRVKSEQCVQHRCTLELIKPEAPKPANAKLLENPSYCDADDECRALILTDDCCVKHFVNKDSTPRMEAEIKAKAVLTTCFNFDRRHVTHLRCENHQCTGDLEVPNEAVDDSRHTGKDRCEQ